MEPILVPWLCLLIMEATRVALVGPMRTVPAHWRAYSPHCDQIRVADVRARQLGYLEGR